MRANFSSAHVDDYEPIVGSEVIDEIYHETAPLVGKHILNINSTYAGGGVAEMLNSLVLLFNDLGVKMGWRILHGSPDFFTVTKKFHNALQGKRINLSVAKKRVYQQVNRSFSVYNHIDHDAVVIHDVQPLPLISCYPKADARKWIWRCHVDITSPDAEVWSFLNRFISRYDLAVVSSKKFVKRDLSVPQRVIPPSINPLSPKNKELQDSTITRFLRKRGVELDKPIIAQISRFDVWKDPLGVLRVFKLVKQKVDCRLVMLGSTSVDDPEGATIFRKVSSAVSSDPELRDVVLIVEENHVLVNALQRAASVILQKSIREGFALTVSESMWKRTPVVGSNVGGIPLQIEHGVNGYLVDDPFDYGSFARYVVKLLKDDGLRQQMGDAGRETVRQKFLITRHIRDWARVLKEVMSIEKPKHLNEPREGDF